MAFSAWKNKDGVKKGLWIFIPLVSLVIPALFFFDIPIWVTLRDMIPREYAYIPEAVTNWGIYIFYAIFAALLAVSLLRKNRKLTAQCLAYLKAQLIFSFAAVRFLKILLGRARPDHGAGFIFFSFNSRYNSFPSGHSADAFVSGVFLYYLLKNSQYSGGRFLPLIFAFLIALSRVLVSAHYPSDVAAGMAIGILGAWFFISRLPDYSSNLPLNP